MNIIPATFVAFCISLYWTMLVRFIFFVLRIERFKIAMVLMIFIPLYFYFLYFMIVYGLDNTIYVWAFDDKYKTLSGLYFKPVAKFVCDTHIIECTDYWYNNH